MILHLGYRHTVLASTPRLKKYVPLFYANFGKRGPIFIFLTVKFRNDLQMKTEL